MSWIDIRIRKPTAEDADERGCVLQRFADGICCSSKWDDCSCIVAWMPMPPFTPIPDPPEGFRFLQYDEYGPDPHPEALVCCSGSCSGEWRKRRNQFTAYDLACIYAVPKEPDGYRLVDTKTEPFRADALMYIPAIGQWVETGNSDAYSDMSYCVPIEPPKPTYRQFRNGDEFRQHRHRWWRWKGETELRPPKPYDLTMFNNIRWDEAFERLEFEYGQPFGMEVTDAQ